MLDAGARVGWEGGRFWLDHALGGPSVRLGWLLYAWLIRCHIGGSCRCTYEVGQPIKRKLEHSDLGWGVVLDATVVLLVCRRCEALCYSSFVLSYHSRFATPLVSVIAPHTVRVNPNVGCRI